MQQLYFISDVHLRLQVKDPRERERRKALFALMDEVLKNDAALIIVGDFFDFYFEWGSVVSTAYHDVYTKLQELTRAGIEVHYFAGNHDFILGNYLEEGLGLQIHPHAASLNLMGKTFFCIHGDGLSPSDWKYRIFRRIIRSRFSIFILRWFIHPNFGHWIARRVSTVSRNLTEETEGQLLDLIHQNREFARAQLAAGADFFVTGHIHLPHLEELDGKGFLTIGDFVEHFSFGHYDGVNLSLKEWPVNTLQ